MQIGIVVYSVTDNTFKFAEAIAAGLEKDGQGIELIRIETDRPVEKGTKWDMPQYEILNVPDCSDYDVIFAGGPVWALSACPVIIRTIEEMPGLDGKTVMPFVTMAFPFPFFGGGNAVRQIKSAARKSGAKPKGGYVLCRMAHDFDKSVNKQVKRILSDIHSDLQ